jgi:6-phosphogluconate dehydrogenase
VKQSKIKNLHLLIIQKFRADIGVIGLAVMGQNLILNLNDKGFKVCAYNRTVSKVDDFLNNEAKGTQVIGAKSLQDLCSKLKEPRRVLLMVKAGDAVDEFIAALEPFLSAGDVIIDGGNSNFIDTNRRCRELTPKGLHFVGCGVSGGEEGARHGPSMMPGGSEAAWPLVSEMFQAIAAKVPKVNNPKELDVCCDWVGPEGSGHFVKMVHNGIEYGDMQLIAEAYHLLRNGLGIEGDELAQIFADWNRDELSSFLIEITADILAFKDDKGQRVVERIRDAAGQKGTGKWTVMAALETGTPVTLIGEAVFARALSSMKNERIVASNLLPDSSNKIEISSELKSAMISNIRKVNQNYTISYNNVIVFSSALLSVFLFSAFRLFTLLKSFLILKDSFYSNKQLKISTGHT